MLEVYFESRKEAITFCQFLFQYDQHAELHWNTNGEIGNRIKIEDSPELEKQKRQIVQALTDVFIRHREIHWISHTIRNYFYYKNKEEIHRIIELTQSIISGEQLDLTLICKDNKPRDTLLLLFKESLEEKVIHFDSIINFRLKNYREELIEVVGQAIDEYKREEDYQTFIQSLREYVDKKDPIYSVVHVLEGHDFTFYKSNGTPFSNMELKMLIKKEPIYIVGLDEEELNLTPLLAMAPKEIRIYGNHPSDPKTLTIMNVFQERVKLESIDCFPFPNYLKS